MQFLILLACVFLPVVELSNRTREIGLGRPDAQGNMIYDASGFQIIDFQDNNQVTWDEANAMCSKYFKSELASVRSNTEFQSLMASIAEVRGSRPATSRFCASAYSSLYLGASYAEGQWQWTDGNDQYEVPNKKMEMIPGFNAAAQIVDGKTHLTLMCSEGTFGGYLNTIATGVYGNIFSGAVCNDMRDTIEFEAAEKPADVGKGNNNKGGNNDESLEDELNFHEIPDGVEDEKVFRPGGPKIPPGANKDKPEGGFSSNEGSESSNEGSESFDDSSASGAAWTSPGDGDASSSSESTSDNLPSDSFNSDDGVRIYSSGSSSDSSNVALWTSE